MLSASRLHISTGNRTLVGPIDLAWTQPELCALIGPNGAGKSTLLRALSGDRRGVRGTLSVRDTPISGMTEPQRAQAIAYLPQQTPLAFGFTVDEVLHLSTPEPGTLSWALDTLDLSQLRHRSLTELSGGERQRVFIARAICQSTPILLLDEPFAALDLRYRIRLEAALQSMAQNGRLVMVVLHDLIQARRAAQRLILMDNGAIVADGPPSDVLTDAFLSPIYGLPSGVLTWI